MAKIQIVWTRGGHVYGNDLVEVGAASVQSEAAPNFGGLPGFAEVTVLEGAVHLLVADAVTTETGKRYGAGDKTLLTIRQGQKVAGIEGFSAVGFTDAAGYPDGATLLNVSSGNKAAAVAAVTLPKADGQMVYLTGFDVSFAGATAASNVLLTIAGLEGDDRTYVVSVPAGATAPGAGFSRTFDPPLAAEDLNIDIVVSLPSLGAGNTHACVNAQGFRV